MNDVIIFAGCLVSFIIIKTKLPVWVLICLFRREGLSNALLQRLQGSNVLSLGRALGVGTAVSGISPCELAAELSSETDFLSSSGDGGELVSERESRDIDKSNGESGTELNI